MTVALRHAYEGRVHTFLYLDVKSIDTKDSDFVVMSFKTNREDVTFHRNKILNIEIHP